MTISINEAQLESHSHFGLLEKNEDFKQCILNLSRKKRILLVDDELDTCFSYQTVLEDAGFKCISYTDSIKALQEFRPNYYDLILLDVRMPVLNGCELFEKIREIDKTVQIIFITAFEGYYKEIGKQRYPELIDDININCLQKPVGNEELIQVLNMVIATKYTN
jgi:two-component system response regulator ChvI